MNNLKNIKEILDLGTSEEKIEILESLSSTDNIEIIQKIISKLDDVDIKVRGEALSSLVLNENKISDLLINSLDSQNKNIRGYAAFVLSNRNDSSAIQAIIELGYSLAEDEIKEISNEKDSELDRLLGNVKKESGPKGI